MIVLLLSRFSAKVRSSSGSHDFHNWLPWSSHHRHRLRHPTDGQHNIVLPLLLSRFGGNIVFPFFVFSPSGKDAFLYHNNRQTSQTCLTKASHSGKPHTNAYVTITIIIVPGLGAGHRNRQRGRVGAAEAVSHATKVHTLALRWPAAKRLDRLSQTLVPTVHKVSVCMCFHV